MKVTEEIFSQLYQNVFEIIKTSFINELNFFTNLLIVVATEEVVTAESVDGAIQQVVSSGGQQVITIVTDGIQLGNLHSIPTSGIGQPIIVTMPDGQQGECTLV